MLQSGSKLAQDWVNSSFVLCVKKGKISSVISLLLNCTFQGEEGDKTHVFPPSEAGLWQDQS